MMIYELTLQNHPDFGKIFDTTCQTEPGPFGLIDRGVVGRTHAREDRVPLRGEFRFEVPP